MLSQRSLGAAGTGLVLPSDDEFNSVSFLSHFDGTNNGTNNVFDDSSSSNHTITANGNVTQGSFGPFARPDGEWAAAFDLSDSLAVSSSSDFDFGTNDFCWECWVFQTSRSGFQLIMAQDDYSTGNSISCWLTNTGQASIYYEGGGTHYTTTATVPLNTWTHLAWVRKGTSTNEFSIYINGTAEVSGTMATSFNQDGVIIGQQANGDYDFIGSISNIRIVNGSHIYASNFTPPTAPLTAVTNTKLLTCQSNRFVDNSASAHTITVSGNPAVSAFGPFLTSEVYDAGVNGASAYFDGSDKLSSSASTDYEFGTGDVTVEYWAYPTASGVIQNILDNRAEASGWKLGRDASNRFHVYNEVTSSYLFESGTFPENAWSHFCWTRASGVNKFFINGVQSGSNVSDSSNFNSNSLNIGVQHGGTTQYFTGYITCCRVIKGTAVEPSGVPTSPPTAVTNTKLLLNMADGQAIDSAAQNNLTLFGDAKISNAQSKFGGTSLALDGTGDFAIAQGFNDLSGPFTIECFARADDTTNAFIWCVGVYKIELGINGNDLRIYRSSGYTNFFTGGEFTVNNWHHVALVRDASDVIKLYLNGTASGTTVTDSTTYAAGDRLFIGGEYASATSINHGWDGYIDDFRVSNTARYTSNFTPPTEPFADKGQ